jgi:hypothetical protein
MHITVCFGCLVSSVNPFVNPFTQTRLHQLALLVHDEVEGEEAVEQLWVHGKPGAEE